MHPVLFQMFGVPLHSYGALLGLSLVIGWHLTLFFCVRAGMAARQMSLGVLCTAIAALTGARLLYVLTNTGRFHSLGEVLAVWNGGLVAYGGFLGGFVGAAVFCRRQRVSLLEFADCAVPSLCTGLLLTRVGCFLNGCDFGAPSEGPWAVHFPAGSPAFVTQQLQGVLPPHAMQSLAVHPTQLYEAAVGVLLLGAVQWRRRFAGQSLVVFTMGYALLRILIETVRADGERGQVGLLSTSQFIAVLTFFSAAGLLVYLRGFRTWWYGRPRAPAPVLVVRGFAGRACRCAAGRSHRRRRRSACDHPLCRE